MRAAFSLASTAQSHGVPWLLENPSTSRCFLTPESDKLISNGAELIIGDQCQYGSLWRKRTGFLVGNVDTLDLGRLTRRCVGAHGLCSRTGKPHHNLEGGHNTKKASQYPQKAV